MSPVSYLKNVFKTKKAEIALFSLIVLYIIVISRICILRFLSLHSHYYDLGIMNQTIYNTAKGRFLELTNPHLLTNTSRLAIHFDPLIAAFAPFYSFHQTPIVLLIGQTLILALGSIAVFAIAQNVIKSKWASLLMATLYLLYYPMQNTNFF